MGQTLIALLPFHGLRKGKNGSRRLFVQLSLMSLQSLLMAVLQLVLSRTLIPLNAGGFGTSGQGWAMGQILIAIFLLMFIPAQLIPLH